MSTILRTQFYMICRCRSFHTAWVRSGSQRLPRKWSAVWGRADVEPRNVCLPPESGRHATDAGLPFLAITVHTATRRKSKIGLFLINVTMPGDAIRPRPEIPGFLPQLEFMGGTRGLKYYDFCLSRNLWEAQVHARRFRETARGETAAHRVLYQLRLTRTL